MIDWEKERINLAGLAMQGMLERDTQWASKIVSDIFYKKLAKHCVQIADALVDELKNNSNNNDGET